MSYFPGVTLVKPLVKIRRERLLPRPGEVAVRVGQEVSSVQVVARCAQETGFQILRASEVLGVPPEELDDYLLVEEGAALQRGMPVMSKRGFLGRTRRYGSPIDGVLYQIRNGSLILQQTPTLFELRALVSGYVVNIFPNRGVVIETNGSLIQALWGSGSEGHGKINVVTETADGALNASLIASHATGNVLVGGRLPNIEALEAAEDNGARGVIVGSTTAALLQAAAKLSFPLLVTDGIGRQPMAEPIFKLLQESQGREASLFGRVDRERGGRPEIVIPLPQTAAADTPAAGAAITVGQSVRLLRGPYRSQMGRVIALHTQPRATDAGLRAPGAEVRMADGEVQFVPYTNLDLIL